MVLPSDVKLYVNTEVPIASTTILVTTTQNRPSLPPFSAVQGNHFHRIDHETSVQDRPVSHQEGIQSPADSGLRWFSDRDPWGDQDSGLSQRLLSQLGLRVEGPSHSRKEGPGQLQLHRSQHLRQPMPHRLYYPEKRIERVESSHADQLKPGWRSKRTNLSTHNSLLGQHLFKFSPAEVHL